MTTYYTGKGDDGKTSILSDTRVSKADLLIEAIGNLDELNSSIGVALSFIDDDAVGKRLRDIQNVIFILGANLASTDGAKMKRPQVKRDAVAGLEEAIKELDSKTPQLTRFVLPGGERGAAHLHLSRTIARRAERSVIAAANSYNVDKVAVAYLNRLSSYLFAAAIYLNHVNGVEESHPTY